MFLDNVVINANDKNFLLNFASLNNRPHALLLDTSLAGYDELLPVYLAKYLLCANKQGNDYCNTCASCQAFNLQVHPDLHQIAVEDKKLFISIQQIKELIDKLAYAPSISELRVCIIKDAHLMNEASANALLKSLEEPQGSLLFLLITDNLYTILPTILSRTIVWHLTPVSNEQLSGSLPSELSNDSAQALIRLSQLNMQQLQQLTAPASQEIRQLAYDFICSWAKRELLYESMQSRWSTVSSRDTFKAFVFYLNYFLRDLLIIKNNCANLAHNIDMQAELMAVSPALTEQHIFILLQLLQESEAMQAVNISPKLLLDNLFVQLINT